MTTVLMSCPQSGLYTFDTHRGTLHRMHPTTCDVHTGLRAVPDGYLWVYGSTDLVRLDAEGTIRARQSLGTHDAHEVALCSEHIYVTNTQGNRLDVYTTDLTYVRSLRLFAADDPAFDQDVCHLNGVVGRGGQIYVTMFTHPSAVPMIAAGIDAEFWRQTVNAGVVCRVEHEVYVPVLANLWQPHTPRFFDEYAVLCNSRHAYVHVYHTRHEPWRLLTMIACEGYYPRGLLCTPDWLYIGLSAVRGHPADRTAKLLAATWQGDVKAEWDLPMREIFDLEEAYT